VLGVWAGFGVYGVGARGCWRSGWGAGGGVGVGVGAVGGPPLPLRACQGSPPRCPQRAPNCACDLPTAPHPPRHLPTQGPHKPPPRPIPHLAQQDADDGHRRERAKGAGEHRVAVLAQREQQRDEEGPGGGAKGRGGGGLMAWEAAPQGNSARRGTPTLQPPAPRASPLPWSSSPRPAPRKASLPTPFPPPRWPPPRALVADFGEEDEQEARDRALHKLVVAHEACGWVGFRPAEAAAGFRPAARPRGAGPSGGLKSRGVPARIRGAPELASGRTPRVWG
jgi:hypothetical protein